MLARQIGCIIAAARGRVGLSLEQLSADTSIDGELLASVERGERLASTAKLDRIASALGLDAFALYDGRELDSGLVVLPRHVRRPDFRHEDVTILRRALERAQGLVDVGAILGRTSLASKFAPAPPGPRPAHDGYHLARRVRNELGQIACPLTNLAGLLAEQFDIPVMTEELATTTLFAATVRSARTRAVGIVLNCIVADGPVPGTRQSWLVERVSICHELCHALFDEPAEGAVVDVILDDPPQAGQDKSPIEQRAGAFAAELLVPLHGLKSLFGDGVEVATLNRAEEMVDHVRSHFCTPAEIAVNHLYNHGYVARVATFREELVKRAQEREVTYEFASEAHASAWRRTLAQRAREAHDAGVLTDGMARALLELDVAEELPWEGGVP